MFLFHQLFYQLFVVCFLASEAPPLRGADGTEGIFGFCRTRVGCGPASGPTLKKALYRTCPVVGQRINKILDVVAIKKGAFGSPLTKGHQVYFT